MRGHVSFLDELVIIQTIKISISILLIVLVHKLLMSGILIALFSILVSITILLLLPRVLFSLDHSVDLQEGKTTCKGLNTFISFFIILHKLILVGQD